jgi:putative membrane protein
MDRTKLFLKNFNIRMLLMRIVLNMLALLFTVLIIPNIYFVDRRFLVWLELSLVLAILNAVVKPVIQVLTLRFIFATAGLVLIVINTIILFILGRLYPQYIAIGGFIVALLGGAVLGLSAAFLESLLGLSQPIVSEQYPEIRERVKDRQFYRTQAELMRLDTQKGGLARELAVTKAVMAGARVPAAPVLPDKQPQAAAAPGPAAGGAAPVATAAAAVATISASSDADANKADVEPPEKATRPGDAATGSTQQEAA